jgi:CheY-like chemotaxis protein/phosphoribosyl 1,2-cyclic phosphodiesterase
LRVRFWGTRGSIARPGPTTLRYGGNTACVEVRAADGTLVVLDCGTGAYALGRELAQHRAGPVRGHLLIGHTHWDHIQGFPFFEPFFAPDHRWSVYAPGHSGRQLEETLAGQMAYEYSPINLEALRAHVDFHDLTEGCLELGGIRVHTQYMNHPALTLGYRLEADGATLVYATDHEPHSLHPHGAALGAEPIHHEDRRHARFLAGADLVIHDAQYTLDEFPGRAGWGHTPVERAVDYALLARAKRLALFHHDPERRDELVDGLLEGARKRAGEAGSSLEVFAAREGQLIELAGEAGARAERSPVSGSALVASRRPRDSVLIVDDDPHLTALLEATLATEGMDVFSAPDGEAALRFARERQPQLILLDMHLPGRDGLEVCRLLRADGSPRFADVPILMLTGAKLEESDLIDAFRAGATDYLTKPIKPTLVRSRVRGWLLRTAART